MPSSYAGRITPLVEGLRWIGLEVWGRVGERKLGLRWRPGGVESRSQLRKTEVSQDASRLDARRHRGDDAHASPTPGALEHVGREHPPQQRCPRYPAGPFGHFRTGRWRGLRWRRLLGGR